MQAIAYHLEQVREGKIKRLIINMPPRNLKSIIASVAFPAFVLGHNPSEKIFCISYADALASKHAADTRAVVESSWYRDAFPNMQISRFANSDLYTGRRGFRKTTTVGGALTGLGGNIFIIDDPQKPFDVQSETLRNSTNNWFSNTLMSRLDNKETGAIILIMQRVHLNDLTGYLTENSSEWTVLNLAAIADNDEQIPIGRGRFFHRAVGEALNPKFESIVSLRRTQQEIGSQIFSAQYQQRPVPTGGAMLNEDWFRNYDILPERR